MENASKALLIAGEVLIGIIILSIFAYVFDRVYIFAESYQNNVDRQRITVFNTQYTKYITRTNGNSDDTYIYAEDVVTLTEQVVNWNQLTDDDSERIELSILDKSGGRIFSTQTSKFDRINFLVAYKLNGDPTQDNKEYKFSCKVETSAYSGRVNKITIQIQGVRDN